MGGLFLGFVVSLSFSTLVGFVPSLNDLYPALSHWRTLCLFCCATDSDSWYFKTKWKEKQRFHCRIQSFLTSWIQLLSPLYLCPHAIVQSLKRVLSLLCLASFEVGSLSYVNLWLCLISCMYLACLCNSTWVDSDESSMLYLVTLLGLFLVPIIF